MAKTKFHVLTYVYHVHDIAIFFLFQLPTIHEISSGEANRSRNNAISGRDMYRSHVFLNG